MDDVFSSNDLEICLIEAKILAMDAEDAEEVGRLVNALLRKAADSNDVQSLVDIAKFIKELALAQPVVGSILLDNLDRLKQPGLFLDILPDIFSSAPAESITELAKKLFEFASTDYLFVRTLAVLVELPLDAKLSETTMKYAIEAIRKVSADEYPVLFRVTLRAVNGPYGHKIISAWRRKVGMHYRLTSLLLILKSTLHNS